PPYILVHMLSYPPALSFFFFTLRRPPTSTLFPYTTLFRSQATAWSTSRCEAKAEFSRSNAASTQSRSMSPSTGSRSDRTGTRACPSRPASGASASPRPRRSLVSAIALIALAWLSGIEWSAIPSSVRGLLSLSNDRPTRTDHNLPVLAAPDCRFHTIMGCRRPGPPGSAPRAVVGEHREFEPQPVGGLGRRQTGDLLDPSQP